MLETILGIVAAAISGLVWYVQKRDKDAKKATEDGESRVALEKIQVLEKEKLRQEYEQRAREQAELDVLDDDDFERTTDLFGVPSKTRNDPN